MCTQPVESKPEPAELFHALDYPVFYSFLRCPYAMRARMGLYGAQVTVEFREIVLRDKPAHMVAISPKATVPVLQLPDHRVIDESFDIMLWALGKSDPQGWLPDDETLLVRLKQEVAALEHTFKHHLDRYKYPDRYPGENAMHNREAALAHLEIWEGRLAAHENLFADNVLLGDIAIFPFVRQFANVDRAWFDIAPIPNVRRWLNHHLDSELFHAIMLKQPLWKTGNPITLFPFK